MFLSAVGDMGCPHTTVDGGSGFILYPQRDGASLFGLGLQCRAIDSYSPQYIP